MPTHPPKTDREMHDAGLATRTFNACRLLLPRPLRSEVEQHPDDPAIPDKKRERLDIVRIRILPVERRPSKFSNTTWCFYAIGVGRYACHRLCLGGIQCLQ